MQEWSDDKLDEFFRKLSEKSEPPYEPDAWKQLKKKLDEAEGKTGWWTKKGLWVLALSGLIGSALLLWYMAKPMETGTEVAIGGAGERLAPRVALPEKAAPADRKRGKAEKRAADNAAPGAGGITATENTSSERPGTAQTATKKENEASGQAYSARSIKSLSRRKNIAGGVLMEPGRRNTTGYGGTIFPNVAPARPDAAGKKSGTGETGGLEKSVPVNEGNPGGISSVVLSEVSLRPLDAPSFRPWEPAPVLPQVAFQAAAPPAAPAAPPAPAVTRWSFRLGIAPDFSAVTLPNFSKPALSGAFFVEYGIAPRWYVQLGLGRNNKIYSALPGQYRWPSNWKQEILPESVDGVCRILEIPLNIRYDFIQKGSTRVFATTGISSYDMLNEKYNYNYKYPDQRIRWYKWEGATGWYWASHLNVSAGFEKKVSRHFSVIAEPYAKIPVRRVGFGNVNLFTTGIWFHINYRLSP